MEPERKDEPDQEDSFKVSRASQTSAAPQSSKEDMQPKSKHNSPAYNIVWTLIGILLLISILGLIYYFYNDRIKHLDLSFYLIN